MEGEAGVDRYWAALGELWEGGLVGFSLKGLGFFSFIRLRL